MELLNRLFGQHPNQPQREDLQKTEPDHISEKFVATMCKALEHVRSMSDESRTDEEGNIFGIQKTLDPYNYSVELPEIYVRQPIGDVSEKRNVTFQVFSPNPGKLEVHLYPTKLLEDNDPQRKYSGLYCLDGSIYAATIDSTGKVTKMAAFDGEGMEEYDPLSLIFRAGQIAFRELAGKGTVMPLAKTLKQK